MCRKFTDRLEILTSCSRAGIPRKNNRTSISGLTRKRTSGKCQCKWQVVAKVLSPRPGQKIHPSWFNEQPVRIKLRQLEHTLPCAPSPAQRRVTMRARGQQIPLPVLQSLLDLVNVNASV